MLRRKKLYGVEQDEGQAGSAAEWNRMKDKLGLQQSGRGE